MLNPANNKELYNKDWVIKRGSLEKGLFKAEQVILEIIKPKLKGIKMLDIGVGCGRTTAIFSNLVDEYVGIDYARAMIQQCKKKFHKAKNVTLMIADATSIKEFYSNNFDLILVSGAALDYMDHYSRTLAIREIRRVLKPGGILIFSSHNLDHIDNLYSIKFNKNIIKFLKKAVRASLMPLLNGPLRRFKNKNWVIIRDGNLRFRLITYYPRITYQIKQLKKYNLHVIKIFSALSGIEISKSNIQNCDEQLVYFLCKG